MKVWQRGFVCLFFSAKIMHIQTTICGSKTCIKLSCITSDITMMEEMYIWEIMFNRNILKPSPHMQAGMQTALSHG